MNQACPPKRISYLLFIHQSADLYGSDRVLRSLVLRLQRGCYRPVVLLPERGPLYEALVNDGIETHIVQVAKVMRSTLSLRGLFLLPFRIAASVLQARKLMAGRNFRMVYSNTLAVLSGAIIARLNSLPHLWHVHEIMASPRAADRGFPALLRLFGDRIVCNSHQTRAWVIGRQPALTDRTVAVLNGIDRDTPADCDATRAVRKFARAEEDGTLVVTLVGRINRMKGQGVLIEAAEILHARGYRHLRFVIVGSPPPRQEHFLVDLEARLAISPARSVIGILGYQKNIWPVWDATDIAVVPSTEPESFGLVAVEAMAAGKPVVASSLGGLLDVIEDGVSGLLIEPGNPEALAAGIARLADNAELRSRLGEAGSARHAQFFSLTRHLDELELQVDVAICG